MIIKIFVAVVTIVHLLGYILLARWTTRDDFVDAKDGEQMKHVWDNTLSEYNNPLPFWWLFLFYFMIGVGFVYLVLFPGIWGKEWNGVLNLNDANNYAIDSKHFEERTEQYLSQFKDMSIEEMAQNKAAIDTGRRLFLHNCSVCHTTDGRGQPGNYAVGQSGYPNLTDSDWLWGGSPDQIYTTISQGKTGTMTPYGILPPEMQTDQNATAIAHYVMSLSQSSGFDATLAAKGEPLFQQGCAPGCHQADGTGRMNLPNGMSLGFAANLTDNVWLHTVDPSIEFIKAQIKNPINGVMPSWGGEPGTPHTGLGMPLGEDRVRILAAYVYHLSNQK